MIGPFLSLETVIRRAPLGLRFVDIAREAPVTGGLIVTAWPVGALTTAGQRANQSPMSGNYGFRSLPGLREYEVDQRPATDWCPTPDNGDDDANFVVAVEDREGRFLPQTLLLCLPKERVLEVLLFSAPGRTPLPGMAAIRGEVWERAANRPASWAMITATVGGDKTYVAIADARGMFALYIPYAVRVSLSPPLNAPVDQLKWPVEFKVFYQPGSQQIVPGLVAPNTRSILNQASARVYRRLGNPARPNVTRDLRFGVDLVLATQNESRLWVALP